jgi:hypothetical protein
MELSAAMNNPDQDTLIRAVEDARRILVEYIEGPPSQGDESSRKNSFNGSPIANSI